MTGAVDLELLSRNSAGDDAFLREIVGMCTEQMQKQIGTLKGLCVDGISDPWREAAHALKGTAATLGAEELRLLSEVAQKQMLDSTAQARNAHVALMTEKYEAVLSDLAELGY